MDYKLFKQAFELVKSKQHFTKIGLTNIVAIKALINKGLSDALKTSPLGMIADHSRSSLCDDYNIKNPFWLAGFAEGEGCF